MPSTDDDTSPAPRTAARIAGLSYVALFALGIYADNESVFTAIVAVPAVIAEAALTIWLPRRAGEASAVASSDRGTDALVAA